MAVARWPQRAGAQSRHRGHAPRPLRRFFLTNQDDYSMTYNGLVLVAEKRQIERVAGLRFVYVLTRSEGLQASSGTTAAGVQASTVSPPDSH